MLSPKIIYEWQEKTGLKNPYHSEHDLLLENCIVNLYANDFLKDKVAFKGGTALHKLYLKSNLRFSEDIDLSQIYLGRRIGSTLGEIRKAINFFHDRPKSDLGELGSKLFYQYDSFQKKGNNQEDVKTLKIEINTREHFSVLGFVIIRHEINNPYIQKTVDITTYRLNELVGQKLGALYQRSKGRDLFDVYYAKDHQDFDIEEIARCFSLYIPFKSIRRPYLNKHPVHPTFKQFMNNLQKKEYSENFNKNINALERRDLIYEKGQSFHWMMTEFLPDLYDALSKLKEKNIDNKIETDNRIGWT
ncbi:MAG: nucleotidyl transferase AbiEii/AbiGii toxin family protein [Flavobacteriaceae bacterium]|nr:nucleotidyl transferase AbiEii/AbiGii toxin family protein [Flavobacteriaceae bacterium]